MLKDDIEIINKLGGPAKVSALLGFDEPAGVRRVYKWRKRGIPYKIKVDFANIFMIDNSVKK